MNKIVHIRCKCGALVGGTSLMNCKGNMKNHKLSKRHRDLIEIKESRVHIIEEEGIKA